MERTNADIGYTPTPWRRNPTLQVVAGASDLARAFGLPTPAVVTNWRSRFPDFPAERVGGSQPKFSLVEVYEWLRDSGPRGRELPEISAEVWWKFLVGAFVRQATVTWPRNTVAAVLLLEHLARQGGAANARVAERWQDLVALAGDDAAIDVDAAAHWLAEQAAVIEAERPDLAGLLVPYVGTVERPLDAEVMGCVLDVVDAIDASPSGTARQRMRRVVAAGADSRNRVDARSTTHALARLMVAAAGLAEGATVLDPAAGEAEVLKECARRASGLRLHGQEIDPSTWAIGRIRLLVAGIEAEFGRPGLDSIREDQFGDLDADVVFIDPPVGDGAPPLDRWVEHGLRHLAPYGRLIVALPAHEIVWVAAARRKPDVRLTKLLAGLAFDGAIEGVALLPRGSRVDVTGPVAVISIRPLVPAADPRLVVVVAPRATGRGGPEVDIAGPLRGVGWTGLADLHDQHFSVHTVGNAELWNVVDQVAAQLEERPSRGRVPNRRPEVELDRLMAPSPSMSEPLLGERTPRGALDGLRERYEQVVAERDAALAKAATVQARHDLLMSSATELVEHLLRLRSELGELHDQLGDDIARVRRDLG